MKKIPFRHRDRDLTEARIIQAATEEFAQRGFTGTSLSKIARKAGCSKAIIYRYFGRKENLYRRILTVNYAELSQRETAHGEPQTGSVEDLLSEILRDLFAFNLEHPAFARLVAWENLAGGEHLQVEEARAAREPGLQRLRAILNKAKANGLVRNDLDVNKFVYALQAITVVYFSNRYTMKMLTDFDFESPATVQEFIRFYASVLAHGISAEKGARA
ncbi:TetR family transcriptional regulator [Candidatus Bipolaricaulota bacterium]|nr:TetR family transcriptional regulator [Candidatus Bipolaricaulota bacterium]